MASSNIQKPDSIYDTVIDVSGTEVTHADSGWYYAEIDLSSVLPSNAIIISVCQLPIWDADVFYVQVGLRRVSIRSATSRTLGNNRQMRVVYRIP